MLQSHANIYMEGSLSQIYRTRESQSNVKFGLLLLVSLAGRIKIMEACGHFPIRSVAKWAFI